MDGLPLSCGAPATTSWHFDAVEVGPSTPSGQVKTLPLPARSPNLNAFAERWVRSVKEECLSKLILFGERSLRRALAEYVAHYHAELNHQGKSNVLLFRRVTNTS